MAQHLNAVVTVYVATNLQKLVSGSGKRSRDRECKLRYMNVTRTMKAGDDGCGVDTLRNPEPRSVS